MYSRYESKPTFYVANTSALGWC